MKIKLLISLSTTNSNTAMKTKLAAQAGRLDTAVIFENKLGAQSYLAYIKALTHSLTWTHTIRRSQRGKLKMEVVQKLDREEATGKIVVLKKKTKLRKIVP